jgi:type I restriction enzyme S subunit
MAEAQIPHGYKQTEVGVIPEDWEVTTVGNEFSIQLGKMLDSEKNVGVPKPYLGNRAVQWRRIDLSDLGVIKMTPSDLQRFRLRQGDLLVCEGGEIGRAAIWNEPIEECYYQKALHRLRPIRGYNVQLMLNVLQRLASTGFLTNFVTQTSIAHLPKDKFETVPIPLPPTKAEQEAIAEALSDADALIESLEQLIAKKRQIKQGAMQELLTGKKRPSGFATKPGYKRTEVGVIPQDWEVKTLGLFCEIVAGRDLVKKDFSPTFDHRHKFPIYSNALTNKGLYGYSKTYQFEPDRITVTARGDIGNAVYRSTQFCAIGRLLVLSSKEQCNLRFVTEYINNFVDFALESTGVPQLTAPQISKYAIALPPTKTEQTAIAAILTDMDAEITALEEKLAKARQLKQGMMQELLTGRIRLV